MQITEIRSANWRIDRDGLTAVATSWATLRELARLVTGGPGNWPQFGYVGDPEYVPPGTTIYIWRWTRQQRSSSSAPVGSGLGNRAVAVNLMLEPCGQHFTIEITRAGSSAAWDWKLVGYRSEHDSWARAEYLHDHASAGTLKASDDPPQKHAGNPVVLDLSQGYAVAGGGSYVQPSSHSEYMLIAEVSATRAEGASRQASLVVELNCDWESALSANGLRKANGTCELRAFAEVASVLKGASWHREVNADLGRDGLEEGNGLFAKKKASIPAVLVASVQTGAIGRAQRVNVARVIMGLAGTARGFAAHYVGKAKMRIESRGEARNVIR